MVKKIFIKQFIKANQSKDNTKSYPKSISKAGIFCKESQLPLNSFIESLKYTFGNKCVFFIFLLSNKNATDDVIILNNKAFNYLGKLKDFTVSQKLGELDLIIDLSFKSSMIKKYALSLSGSSFKIAMGKYLNEGFHLCINVDRNQQDLFAEELLKYHKILSHVE